LVTLANRKLNRESSLIQGFLVNHFDIIKRTISFSIRPRKCYEKSMERASTSCPICKKDVKARGDGNASFPFCSARCKTIDLGKWVNEEYAIAVEGGELLDDEVEVAAETDPEPDKPVRH
jgi:uncharacterized protein